MKAPKPKAAFEWGGRSFSDRDGLESILASGYFREGPAWGSIRSGWAEVVDWRMARELLVLACRSRMVARSHGMRRLPLPEDLPEALSRGAGEADGEVLWLAAEPGGFMPSAAELWAKCEAWLIGASSKSPAKPKGKVPAEQAASRGRL